MEEQVYKMRIKAKVNCPHSALSSNTETYNGLDVEIIDFVTTGQGVVAVGLIEKGNERILYPFGFSELRIEKNKKEN